MQLNHNNNGLLLFSDSTTISAQFGNQSMTVTTTPTPCICSKQILYYMRLLHILSLCGVRMVCSGIHRLLIQKVVKDSCKMLTQAKVWMVQSCSQQQTEWLRTIQLWLLANLLMVKNNRLSNLANQQMLQPPLLQLKELNNHNKRLLQKIRL